MRKITLVSLALATVLGSLAGPSLAQMAPGRGNGNGGGGHHEGRGEYVAIPGAKRKPVVLVGHKSGAYCSTNLRVLFDDNGRRTKVRHCDDRNHIEID